VTRLLNVPKDTYPAATVHGLTARTGLVLITCGGAFSRRTAHYENSIIVFARSVNA